METLRGSSCRLIREAIQQYTAGAVCADLAVAARYAYDGACDRARGNERVYAMAAVRVQALTATAFAAAPDMLTGHLIAAICALLYDDLAAVPVHLQQARYVAAVTVGGGR